MTRDNSQANFSSQDCQLINLEPEVQNILFDSFLTFNNFGSVPNIGDMAKEDYVEMKSCRKRNLSNSSCDSNEINKFLYGQNKDIIYYDLREDDTLPKLALEFACNVSEIKQANKIYNEMELHALRTIKIPVVKGGAIFEKYTNPQQNSKEINLLDFNVVEGDTRNSSDTNKNSLDDSSNIFAVQTEHLINPGYDYLTGEDDEEDYDLFNKNDLASSPLLDSMVDILGENSIVKQGEQEPTLDEFITRVDERISTEIKNVESNREGSVLNSIAPPPSSPVIDQNKSDQYGTVCYFSWKFYLALLCMIAIVAPILYFIYFYKNKS